MDVDEMGEPRFLENVQLFLKRAASKLDIPKDMYEYIEKCHSVVRFDIPLQMDDGKFKSVTCYRA
jgi:glutamate dehydrogenase/leucine dehydrogenase